MEFARQAERLGIDSVWSPEFWAADALIPPRAPRRLHVHDQIGLGLAQLGVVRQVLDGIEAAALKVMADDVTREMRAGLHHPVDARYAPFVSETV